MRPQTAVTTIAARTARGRSVKNHVKVTRTTTTSPAERQAGDLAPAAGLHGGRRLRQASCHAEPAREAGGDVRRAHADELALGLDAIAATRSEQARRREPLRQGHQRERHTTDGDRPEVAARDRRQAERREPGGHLADRGHTLGPEVEQPRHHDTEHERRQPPRHLRRQATAADKHDEGEATDDGGAGVGLIEALDRTDEHTDQVAGRLGDPKQGWHLADDDRERQTEHEASHDRVRQELRDPTKAQQADRQQGDPRCDGERGRDRHGLLRVAAGDVGDKRPRHDRDGRRRTNDQLRRRAEAGVCQQREGHRVQPDLHRHPRDAGIAERLRHEQGGDDDPGQQIAREVAGPVRRQPPKHRHDVRHRRPTAIPAPRRVAQWRRSLSGPSAATATQL